MTDSSDSDAGERDWQGIGPLVVVAVASLGIGVLLGGQIAALAEPVPQEATAATTPAPEVDIAVDSTCAFDRACIVEIDVNTLEDGNLSVLANGFAKRINEPGRYVYRVAPDSTVTVTHQNDVLYGAVVADDANVVTDDLRRGADAQNVTHVGANEVVA